DDNGRTQIKQKAFFVNTKQDESLLHGKSIDVGTVGKITARIEPSNRKSKRDAHEGVVQRNRGNENKGTEGEAGADQNEGSGKQTFRHWDFFSIQITDAARREVKSQLNE